MAWEFSLADLDLPGPKQLPEVPVDELFLNRLAKLKTKAGTKWELGAVFSPKPVFHEGFPVYPVMAFAGGHGNEACGGALKCRKRPGRSCFGSPSPRPPSLSATCPPKSRWGVPLRNSPCRNWPLRVACASGASDIIPGPLPGPASGNKAAPPEYRPPSKAERSVFRVDLVGAKPPIWRRLAIPVDATFFDLNLAIQAAFGWGGGHLHCFEKRAGRRPVLEISWQNDGHGFDWRPEMQTPLDQFFYPGAETMNYVYDYGDDWDHKIKLEKIDTDPVAPGGPFMKVRKGKGANPIEDCGGIYALQAIIAGDSEFSTEWPAEVVKRVQEGRFEPKEVRFREPREELARLRELSRF